MDYKEAKQLVISFKEDSQPFTDNAIKDLDKQITNAATTGAERISSYIGTELLRKEVARHYLSKNFQVTIDCGWVEISWK